MEVNKMIKAAEEGNIGIVRASLNDDDMDVNASDNIGWTALSRASSKGHEEIVKLLLDKGADIEAKVSLGGISALSLACKDGHDSTVMLLLNRNARIDGTDKHGLAPLHYSCHFGRQIVTKLLLDFRANINSICEKRFTPLHKACDKGYTQCVKELLMHGANTDVVNNDGKTPFDLAFEGKHQSTIECLLEHETSIDDLRKKIRKNPVDDNLTELQNEPNKFRSEMVKCACSSKICSLEKELCSKIQNMEVHNEERLSKMFEHQKKVLESNQDSLQTIHRYMKMKKDLERRISLKNLWVVMFVAQMLWNMISFLRSLDCDMVLYVQLLFNIATFACIHLVTLVAF